MSFETLRHYHELGLILVPMTVKDGHKIPLITYKGYREKSQDLATLSGLYEEYKNTKPLHWAVYCVNGIVGLDFDCPRDFEIFFNNVETLTIRSPSGGYHPFFRSLTRCKAFKMYGVEVKINELCTIVGDDYVLLKNSPIKEIQDIEAFVKKAYPADKKRSVPKHLKDLKITDVAEAFSIKKVKSGHNYWTALCPIHKDTVTDHLYIYEDSNQFHCFKCGKHGDFIDLVMYKLCLRDREQAVKHIENALKIKIEKEKIEPYIIPQEEIDPTPIAIDEALKEFKKDIYIQDDINITVPIAYVISNFAPCDPDVLGIIAPSGSGKTEVIRALGDSENQYSYPLSSITAHTFASGLKENQDLAPALQGRLIAIKDLTTILSKKSDEVSQIFADIREVTDGYLKKDFGSGVKKHYSGLHTSFLFGSTNAIEKYYSLYSVLGQRIIFFRPLNDPVKSRQQAMKNAGREKEIREKQHAIIMRLLKTILESQKERISNLTHSVPDDMQSRIGFLCDFLAVVRTHIDRDQKGNMAALPEPEFPTRLIKTMCKIIDAHALLFNRSPEPIDEAIAVRLIHDNIPTERLQILKTLVKLNKPTPTPVIGEMAKIPTEMTKRVLNDLKALGIVEFSSRETTGGRSDEWSFVDENSKKAFLAILLFTKFSAAIDRLRGANWSGYDAHDSIEPILYALNFFNYTNNKEIDIKKLYHTYLHLTSLHSSDDQEAEPTVKKPENEKPADLRENIPEIPKIETTLKDFEKGVHYKPLERQDIQRFLEWFAKNIDKDIPASKIKEIVWKLKRFTPENGKNDNCSKPEPESKPVITVEVAGVTYPVEEGL